MTTISAKVIADSVSPKGARLTTLELRYPRFIHSEFMTHRAFSRNASSSRAIPAEKLIAAVYAEPAAPIYWGSNQPGMQAGTELTGDALRKARMRWQLAADAACDHARRLLELKCHKQIVNRVIEPYSHISVVVTATEWANFFELRLHKDAEPHIQHLAREMELALAGSLAARLQDHEWHLPYVSEADHHEARNLASPAATNDLLVKVSTARCARVSYLTHDKAAPTVETDLKLYDRLLAAVPLHASPSEHQGQPDDAGAFGYLWGNFRGWKQHRKIIENAYLQK